MLSPFILIVVLGLVFLSAYMINRIYFDNEFAPFTVLCSFLLYLIPTTSGILGVLSIYSLFLSALLLFLITLISYYRQINSCAANSPIIILFETRFPKLEASIAVLFILGIVLSSFNFLTHTIGHHLVNIHPFHRDAVCTSFPMLVDIIQTGSIWTMKQPYSSYLGGYEMIQSWGIVFLKTEAIIGIIHYFFLFLLLFFSCCLLHDVAYYNNGRLNMVIVLSYLGLIVCLLNYPLLQGGVYRPFGKTDLPVMAYSVMATHYLFENLNDANRKKWFDKNLILFSIALHLMVTVKPQGMLYALCLMSMLSIHVVQNKLSKTFLYAPFISMAMSLVWYIRAFIGRGASHADIAFKTTIIYNLIHSDNPLYKTLFHDFYLGDTLPVILFSWNHSTISLFIIIIILLSYLACWKNLDARFKIGYLLVWGSIGTLMLTPYAVWWPVIQLRYSLALFPLLFVLLISGIYRCGKIIEKKYYITSRSLTIKWNFKYIKETSIVFFLIVFIFQSYSYKSPHGFPGPDGYKALKIYRWIYDNIENQKIGVFNIGVYEPYGLYGKNFSNHLFTGKDYLRGSDCFKSKSFEQMPVDEVAAMLKKEKINYLITKNNWKEKVLKRKIEILEPVYSDAELAIFKFE